MVSFWPWKADETSPASFEKALSTLSVKISKSQNQLDSLRQTGRRYKALWTLYTSFAYLLCVIVLFLVVGWQNWTAWEYTAVAGSPLLIYLIRTGVATYYTFRIESVAQRLESQQVERAKTIDKLKTATKYNSTQELLEKYGGAPPKPKKQASTSMPTRTPKNGRKPAPGRTSMGPPPPTANIRRSIQMPSDQMTQKSESSSPSPPPAFPFTSPAPETAQPQQAQAEFAPNAFSALPQYATTSDLNMSGNWYDRVLDLLLGEDETSPKNRIVLICRNCRLVNGQAPPGTKSLAELGKWKCIGCGETNGEEDEAVRAMQEMKRLIHTQENNSAEEIEKKQSYGNSTGTGGEEIADIEDGNENESENDYEAEDEPAGDKIEVSKPERERPKGSRKKT